MPKMVTSDTLARWRKLQAEGRTYSQIARLTGWQSRTVRRHLQADVRSEEAQSIRRELFKELLGQHWEMLIERVVAGLQALDPLPSQEVAVLVSEPGAQDLQIGGVDIACPHRGDFSVTATARATTEWDLLMQHIPKDRLWTAVSSFEESLATELDQHRALYLGVEEQLSAALSLPVVESVQLTAGLSRGIVRWAYMEALQAAAGREFRKLTSADIHESTRGQIKIRDVGRAAFAPERADDVISAINATISTWSESVQAGNALSASQESPRTLQSLGQITDYLRLLRYLPGVCEVCSRIQI